MTSAQSLFLLDTNILVHLIRASSIWATIRNRYNLLAIDPRPCVSVVSEGEIRSLALQYGWGQSKLSQLEYILGYFHSIKIHDRTIIDRYAVFDAYCLSRGQALGKNDLWIAATASSIGARLLTTDRDFDSLAPNLLDRDWIDPDRTNLIGSSSDSPD